MLTTFGPQSPSRRPVYYYAPQPQYSQQYMLSQQPRQMTYPPQWQQRPYIPQNPYVPNQNYPSYRSFPTQQRNYPQQQPWGYGQVVPRVPIQWNPNQSVIPPFQYYGLQMMMAPSRQIIHSPQRLSVKSDIIYSHPQLLSSPQRFNPYQSPSRMVVQNAPQYISSVLSPQQMRCSPSRIRVPQTQPIALGVPVQQVLLRQVPQTQLTTINPVVYRQSPQKPSQVKVVPQVQGQSPQAKREDDLDKRFNQAMERTKKIVDKMKEQQPSPAQQQTPQKPVPQIQHKVATPPAAEQEEQEEEDQDLQDLALQYEDGYIYRGQGIAPQTRHGFGVLTDSDGNEIYAGFWKENVYHGEGRLYNTTQDEIEGPLDYNDLKQINNGWAVFEGYPHYHYNQLKGFFSEGKMEGVGTLQMTNGEKYEGEFKDGMVDGEGTYFTQDERQVKGVWEKGNLVDVRVING